MKKFISILAIAFVSLNFVSCRQDDVTSEMGVNNNNQENVSFRKGGDTVKVDSTAKLTKRAIDPDPPVKDGTSW